ncbi:hypothetical protein FIBSPDRAFT_940642 [Athelia psychrophila]|uniref:Uncharacterized protein n=1 Tax=Athelia psychrophila TaxID=1759441 RepID=A0A167VKU9_9AGAM|nr:hypothetical protein FIBSPDRAFT_940642 [Fibularhizoctonia sp. CBS 109695]
MSVLGTLWAMVSEWKSNPMPSKEEWAIPRQCFMEEDGSNKRLIYEQLRFGVVTGLDQDQARGVEEKTRNRVYMVTRIRSWPAGEAAGEALKALRLVKASQTSSIRR